MQRIFHLLRPLIRTVARSPWLVLTAAALLAVLGIYLARGLRIDTDIVKLLPPDYPSVQALDRLKEHVGGETALAIGIESPSFDANKAFAEALIPQMLALAGNEEGEPLFSRVEYRRDTEFLQNNALYFATPAELQRVQTYLQDQIEAAKLEANPFYFSLEDEDAEATDSTADDLLRAYDRIVGKEYPISDDSTAMAVHFYPSASNTNIGSIERMYASVEDLVAQMRPSEYHPNMEVVVAGRLLRRLSEVNAITRDVARSFGIGVTAVLLLVIFYFTYKLYSVRSTGTWSGRLFLSQVVRAPLLGILIALPLLMGLSWTFGLAYLVLGSLNLMTSTLGLVLFGLGIDFGIHFYARYTEVRASGRSPVEAAEHTFMSTGQAITVGAMTTSAGLFVLMLADFRGFSEFGFIAGTGILFALIAMIVVLPAVLIIFERLGLISLDSMAVDSAVRGRSGRPIPAAPGIVIASAVTVLIAVIQFPNISFEYEFGKLEPTYEVYNRRQDVVGKVVGSQEGRRNPTYVVVDNAEEVPAVMEAVRAKIEQDTLSPTIGLVESLQERFPMKEQLQNEKLAEIGEIRSLLEDPILRGDSSTWLTRLRRASGTDQALEIQDVPEKLRKQFTSKSGEVGNFVIIYPSISLADGRNSIAFSNDVGRIETDDGDVYHAASSSLVAADMLRLMRAEAPWMVGATFAIVALLMWLNFGAIRWAALAMLPLVVGVLWMVLAMEILDMSLNFYNLVVLPAVLGIGNDAGVHLVHRYREEGAGSLAYILRTTGEHVTISSLTTMIGFGGLLFSFHPGLRSIGQLAVVGIGATLLAAIVFLPAMLQLLENRAVVSRTKSVQT